MDNNAENELRTKLSAMSWNNLRKEAKKNGIKANMKKALLIDAIVHKVAAQKEALSDSVEILTASMSNSASSLSVSKNPFASDGLNVANNCVTKTGRTFKYVVESNLVQDNTGELGDDEASAYYVSSKKHNHIDFLKDDEITNVDEKESRLSANANFIDGKGDDFLPVNITCVDQLQSQSSDIVISGEDKLDKNDPNINLLDVDPHPFEASSVQEIRMNFEGNETSSFGDEDTQSNATYDLPQNDGECEDNRTVDVNLVVSKSDGETIEVNLAAEGKEMKYGQPECGNISCTDEPLVDFETIEGAIEKSGEMKVNDSLMLYTSTPLFADKTLPAMHVLGSAIQNLFSKQSIEEFCEAKPLVELAKQKRLEFDLHKIDESDSLKQTGILTNKVLSVQTSETNFDFNKSLFDTQTLNVPDTTNSLSAPCGSAKLTPSSVRFRFGNVAPSDIATVQNVNQSKSILKKSSMSANRSYSVASQRIDCKRRTIEASKSSSRLSRVGSVPGTDRKLKHMASPRIKYIDLNSTGEKSVSRETSGVSRGRSEMGRTYTPYSGRFFYKDTSKMRDDELKRYNEERNQRQDNRDSSKKLFF